MPRILILTTSHGASHRRAAEALRKAFLDLDPALVVEVTDAFERSARWFRAYYASYLIPLRYFPGLWRRIERKQQQSASTNPVWLYRLGGRPLFRYISSFAPDAVVATEVGVAELAALHKRTSRARYLLAGIELMDFNRAWVQPEIDLYAVVHSDLGEELIQAGAPAEQVLDCGMPIGPAFASLPEQKDARARLGIAPDIPVVLALFGGAGFGSAEGIFKALGQVKIPFLAVFITGKNAALEARLHKMGRRETHTKPKCKVLGWVDNMHEWMAAADLVIGKPGGSTLMEAAACGVPFFAFDPLPGNEERTCAWLEKWGAGVWVRDAPALAPSIERVLLDPAERLRLRERAKFLARPNAAAEIAKAILKRLPLRPVPAVVKSVD